MKQYTPAHEAEPENFDSDDSIETNTQLLAFEPSTYGAFIYSYCRLTGEGTNAQYMVVWYLKMVYAMILHLLGLVMAVSFVFALFATSIEFQEDMYEVNLTQKTEILLHHIAEGRAINATSDANPNNVSAQAQDLCYLDKTLPFSHPITVFVLTMKMVPEIMDGFWFIIVLWITPLEAETRLKHITDKNIVVSLTRASKVVMFICVPFAKLCVSCYVLYVGSKQIIMNHTTFKLIMQVIGLTYIICLDEWVFSAFFSLPFQEKVKSTYFRMPATESYVWRNECLGPLKLLCAVALALVLWGVVFQDLRAFRMACREYKQYFQPKHWTSNHGLQIIGLAI